MNLFANLPPVLPEELVETLHQSAAIRIERIVSHGHASPDEFWYDQPQNEWVVVLRGAARLRFEDKLVEMGPGDTSTFRPTRSTASNGRRRTSRPSGSPFIIEYPRRGRYM